MSWVKIDDNFTDHPKVKRVSLRARWLHLEGLCYCARFLTDGAIPCTFIAEKKTRAKDVRELVKAGLWTKTGDGFAIHDYLEFNWSRERILKNRKATAERQARWAERHPAANAVRDAVPNAVTNASPFPALPNPTKELSTSPVGSKNFKDFRTNYEREQDPMEQIRRNNAEYAERVHGIPRSR